MKSSVNKNRVREIKKVYRSLGIESEEMRNYLISFGSSPTCVDEKKQVVFIEAGTTSYSQWEVSDAGLDPNTE